MYCVWFVTFFVYFIQMCSLLGTADKETLQECTKKVRQNSSTLYTNYIKIINFYTIIV